MRELQPTAVTAVMLGLKSRMAVFSVQRRINTYSEEALLAILPGVALQQLWDAIGGLETALLAISILVVGTGFLGMTAVSLSGLNERRREMAILRSVGARPVHVFLLLVVESGVLAAIGAFIGAGILYAALVVAQPIIQVRLGFYLPIDWPSTWELTLSWPCYCRWRYLRIYTRTPRLQALARRRDVYSGVGADTGVVECQVNLGRALTWQIFALHD